MSSPMDWKDLLALTTGIFGLVFALLAHRRATAADQRADRIEKQTLLDAVVQERQQALAEVQSMLALWTTRDSLMQVYGAADSEFESLKKSQTAALELCKSLISFEVAQVREHQDLVNFRLKWRPALNEVRAKEDAMGRAFEVLFAKFASEGKRPVVQRGDA
jgi:hypothetical protein